jgi:hypothetical protein
MNSPEWVTIMIGCISCLVSGLVQPSCAILLTKTVNVSHPLSFFRREMLCLSVWPGTISVYEYRAAQADIHVWLYVLAIGRSYSSHSFLSGMNVASRLESIFSFCSSLHLLLPVQS